MILGNVSRADRKQAMWMTVAAVTIVMLAGSFVVIALGSMGSARAEEPIGAKEAIALTRGDAIPAATPEEAKETPAPARARHEREHDPHVRADAGSAAFRVNINVADADQLALLPGLGKKRAKAVIAWRSLHPFVTAADLMRVKGIGPGVFDRMSRFVVVEGPPVTGAPPAATVRAPRPRPGSRGA